MRRQALLAILVAVIASLFAAGPALAYPWPPPGDGSLPGQADGGPYGQGEGDPSPQGGGSDLGSASDPSADPSDATTSDPAAADPAQLPTDARPDPALPSGPLTPSIAPTVPAPPAPKSNAKPTKVHKHAILDSPVVSGPTIPGTSALILSSGLAVPPATAPRAVKVLIWTANRLIGVPYRYGGGHASFSDNAYDCSGSVSYALHAAGLISNPEDSGSLESWGSKGPGRWLTVYTNSGHAWMIVAGIRLDTSPVDDPVGLDGPRWRPAPRPTQSFRVRHAVVA